jgi:ADP-heptose:LPS heptosyltransferase
MKKILIIRFSSIGDIILTTPVIRAVKQQLGAEVHFLVKKRFKAVLEANPYIDRLHLIDKEVAEVLPALKAEGFDLIIDLHKNIRSFQVKRALRTKSVAFDKINLEKWLMVNFKMDRLPNKHIVDRNLEMLAPWGVQNDGQGLDYFILETEEVDIPAFFGRFPTIMPYLDVQEGKEIPYIAFVTGAAHATKRLPSSKIITICEKLEVPVVLLGGPDEEEKGDTIAQAAGRHVVNACGKLSLNESASLVRQASKVIAHDTGLMHMAAAFGKEIISVWGNTIPEFGMYPYYPEGLDRNTSIEVKGLKCRPCSKIGYKKCPKKHFKCMMDIDEGKVLKALND